MKKLLSIVCAFLLSFTFALPVFAAESTTGSITIQNPNTGNTYNVYQILTGQVATVDNATVLSNPEFGSSVASNGTVSNTYISKSYTTAQDLATALAGMSDSAMETAATSIYADGLASQTPVATLTSSNSYTATLPQGYYIISEVNSDGTLVSQNRFISVMLGNVTVYPKTGDLTSNKQVLGVQSGKWQTTTDQMMNKKVEFKLTANLPGNVTTYDNGYNVVFNDTLSQGLTYDKDATVEITNKSGETVLAQQSITATTASNTNGGTNLAFTMNDIVKTYGAGNYDTITIIYTATVNENAYTGKTVNPNTLTVTYSNNVENSSSTGTTAQSTVGVLTYKITVNKVNGDNAALAGAQFTLTKLENGTWTSIGTGTANTAGTSFVFTGLNDGEYCLTETTTPTGYNTADPIYFTITSSMVQTANQPGLAESNGLTITQTDKDGTALTTATATFSLDSNDDISTTVVNKKGLTLPKTGMLGSSLIYMIGFVLVVIGAVIFIRKQSA
jgi:fimbrial isopeptide formation D2 family protein/LPXTG-motif cell wall-anchored protein